VNAESVRRRFGPVTDTIAHALTRTDPLAEAVVAAFGKLPPGRGRIMLDAALQNGIDSVPDAPPALVALFAQLDRVPRWVDWKAMALGSATYLRHGVIGAAVVGGYALPIMYASPAGNKPLVFSSRFVEKASRRLAETAHFVSAVTKPNGLRRDAEGFHVTVKVRLMHAQVRRLLARSERWKWDQWGAPVNQADLLGTNLALSALFIDGARRLGFQISRIERDSYMQLWRYAGYLMGIEEALLPATFDEAWVMQQITTQTQGPPDADSRALVTALRALPQHLVNIDRSMHDALCRHLLGNEMADALGFPKSRWAAAVPLLRGALTSADLLRRIVPGASATLITLSERMYKRSIDAELKGHRPEFAPPDALRNTAVLRRSVVMNSLRSLGGE
jgi:hypothetical protein